MALYVLYIVLGKIFVNVCEYKTGRCATGERKIWLKENQHSK